MFIYLIRNKVNDKVYVGKTAHTVEERFSWHVRDAKVGKQRKLYTAMRKIGTTNFFTETIYTANTAPELNQKEEELIKAYNAVENGYNSSYRAFGIIKHTDEAKERMHQKALGRPSPNKGKKASKATRAKQRAAHLGQKLSNAHRRRIAEGHLGVNTWMYGRKLSEDTKRKMSESAKKRWKDENRFRDKA